MRTRSLFPVALGLGFLLSCGIPEGELDDYEVVPAGKEDNYRGSNSREYSATADAIVTLAEGEASLPEAERLAKARELVSAKLVQIGWFLNLYVADKEDEDTNKSYGGFHAMARNASVASLKLEAIDERNYRFNFEATIAGENNFLQVVPGAKQPDGARLVELKLGKLTNEELLGGASWQSRFGVHSWDPATAAADAVETIPLTVRAAARSSNAFLNYQALYSDDKLSVGVQFGWDYNAGRQDLANARELYDHLLAAGFTSPVKSYDELKLDSPPLTRSSRIGERTVEVELKLVHPGMVPSPSENAVDLRNALLDLLATREVILFNGHAGVSGRLLPADFQSTSAGNIKPEEYATLKLLPGFQLLLVDGCQTYARFTDGFRQNPLKRGPNGELKNLEIVTSASYTWTSQAAETIEAILWPLVGKSASSVVKPVTWDDVLRTLNAAPNHTSFFGINGIDSDPHGHPYARLDLLGQSCKASADCGGLGNLCARTVPGSKVRTCATVCLDDAGCPSDFRCSQVANGSSLSGKACVKR